MDKCKLIAQAAAKSKYFKREVREIASLPSDCHFELKSFPVGTTVHNDDANINYLI